MFFEAASSFAQALPEEVRAPLMSARLTALAKEDWRSERSCHREHSRGRWPGNSRKSLRKSALHFNTHCRHVRETDGVGHMLRAATDHDQLESRRDWSVRPHIEVSHVDEVGADAHS